ncbi:MAG: proline--tRNA ligase [Clostridia bacterium]|nr:proline--tRNA ligase [Clostridia bacterium]
MAKEQKNNQFVKEIADMTVDFPQWYTDVVLKTQLVDYGPVKGTMVIRPYGYEIWERIQEELNVRFKATGHKNAYFPLFIPYSYLVKEAEHVEGFAPEVALVTHVGDTPLEEKLVVRPTSETIICSMYAKWVQSYRDLPVLINQWANVVRWEKTTRPFLRTSEFLWQEGHTLHRTEEEAREETLRMLEVYREFMQNVLAIDVLTGVKTQKEKFAGAVNTYSMEAMMLDGKSLQAGTSHYLGQNFSSSFEIKYLDSDGQLKNPYQTSWGVSTRLIGALIMAHGDQRGLKLPPRVAPIQVVVVPIAVHKEGVLEKAQELVAQLKAAGVRVELDDRDQSPGWKFNEWEMKGVPVRIEIGPRDIENGQAVAVRRDTHEKSVLALSSICSEIPTLLDDIHENMFKQSHEFLHSHIDVCSTMEEMKAALDKGHFVKTTWCGCRECEDKIKAEYSATSRVLPFDQTPVGTKCVCCGKEMGEQEKKVGGTIYFAKSY